MKQIVNGLIMQDIRYKQRFQNYENAFKLLKDSLSLENPSILEKAGIIQFFELTFEIGWKLLKDYCEFEGYTVNSPREAIKTAYMSNLISNGEVWLKALHDRNLTVHIYDEEIADEVYQKIKDEYFAILEELYNKFKKELS
jgi:nucleotidyltransferase substrate binding protein (TIGR01987 family)